MAYGDQKIRKSRPRGYTQADERRWRAQERREARERHRRDAERQAMLDAMSALEREQFLANEEAARVREDAEREARQEEYNTRLRLQRETLVGDSRLMAGFVQSEIAQAIAWKETYGHHQGDWLDDPIEALTGQGGFGEEVTQSKAIKLQIHLCLDCSNSMYHNQVNDVSVEVMRTIYLALESAGEQLPPNSLTTHLWLWAKGEDGKEVEQLTDPNTRRWGWDEDDPRGATRWLPGRGPHQWTGEDTWIHPLLEALDKWELESGDPGAYRLDIIISDGMLEHPTDARKGDVIQDRRDGNLQSIVLNFLPMSNWGDFRVPNRCVQYPATADNLMGLMRAILGDWIVQI